MIEHVAEGCQCEGKQCRKCERIQCFGQFRPHKNGKPRSECRECERTRAREYARKHAEERRLYSHHYHQSHREQCLAGMRRRYKENVGYHREYARNAGRITRRTHRLKLKEVQKRSYQRNLAHYRTYQRSYRETHRETINSIRREKKYHATPEAKGKYHVYRQKNRERLRPIRQRGNIHRRARLRNAKGTYTLLEWLDLKRVHNYTCLCCGRREPDIKLTVDHVIPLVCGGSNSIDNIQPLCLSCNSSKQAKIIDYRPKGVQTDGYHDQACS